jgi:hypothetical protein
MKALVGTQIRRKERNSFEVALVAATTRYGKAVKEREACVQTLDALNQELPALQQTIVALQRQLHPNDVTFRNSNTGLETIPTGEVRVPGIPPEIAKLLPRQDLTGIGSIPAAAGTPTEPLTEDELLPDIEGTPMVKE